MKKFYTSMFLTALLCSATSGFANADSNVSILINGVEQVYDQPPILTDAGRTLVPLRGIFEKLQAQVNWDDSTQTVTTKKGNDVITIKIGSSFADKDGQTIFLDQSAQIINGRTMVPLRFIGEALGATVNWDGQSQSINISTASTGDNTSVTGATYTDPNNGTTINDNSVSNNDTTGTSNSTTVSGNAGGVSSTTGTSVIPSDVSHLTYQQALDMANSNSWTLKNALTSIDQTQQALKQASDNVHYVPSSGGNSSGSNGFINYAQAQINSQISQKTLQVTQDTITYAVKQAYNNVLLAQNNLQLYNLALQNAQIQANVVNAQHQVGTASALDLSKAQSSLSTAQANVQAGTKALSNAYQAFNTLVGLPADATPVLTDIPTMTKMQNVDVETKVSQAIAQSPDLYKAGQQVNLSKLQLQLYTFNNPSSSNTYQGQQDSITQAYNSQAALQDSLSKSVRSTYYSIKQSEDSYDSLQAQLAADLANVNAVKVKFDNGMATQADYVAAQLAVQTDQNKLFSLTVQHDDNLMVLDKPWVGSTSGS